MFSFKKKDPVKKSFIELDEIDKLKERISSKDASIFVLNRQIEDINSAHTRNISDLESKQSREIDSITSSNKISLLEKDAEIKSLQNKIARIESEMEARLALQEDIHADEILAIEDKYLAKASSLEIKYKAKDDSLDTMQEIDKKHMNARAEEVLAEAKSNATEIIKSAYEEAFEIKKESVVGYESIVGKLYEKINNKDDISQLIDLVKASTENYPAFPTKVSSTSSSK